MRKIVELVRLVTRASLGTFEMGDKGLADRKRRNCRHGLALAVSAGFVAGNGANVEMSRLEA
jgi:hypothetical protein